MDYLYKLTDDVEARLKSGDRTEEKAAQKTIERKLLPKYNEMCRQLLTKKTGVRSKVLAAGSKFLQIDAAPWTPEFYGQLLETFFGSLDIAEAAVREGKSTERRAFQYLARLEEQGNRVA